MSKFLIGNIKGPKGDKGEQGATGPEGKQGIQGPVGPAGGVNSVNGMTGDVEIGQGVNLLTGTKDLVNNYSFRTDEIHDGFNVIHVKNQSTNNINFIDIQNIYPHKLGESFTFSFYAKGTNSFRVYFYQGISCVKAVSSQGIESSLSDGNIIITLSEEWTKYYVIFTLSQDGDISVPKRLLCRVTSQGDEVYMYAPKLERGTVPNPVWTPAPEDVVTKTPYDIFTALDGIPEMHRNLYGGRNLGESTQMSEAHKKAIQDGSFKDLWVGDYWTHEGIKYRIADIDYFYNCGDTNFTTHHLVIVPDTCLGGNKLMHPTVSTENGYKGSDMHESVLPSIKADYIDKAFPSLVLSHKEYFTNAVTGGHPSGGGWVDATVELMNEIMVYGCPIFTPANNGTTVPALYTIGNSQLSLFRINPCMIKIRQSYWLRDVVSASNFAYVYYFGDANCISASNAYVGVRPYFCIGVQPSGDEADDDM